MGKGRKKRIVREHRVLHIAFLLFLTALLAVAVAAAFIGAFFPEWGSDVFRGFKECGRNCLKGIWEPLSGLYHILARMAWGPEHELKPLLRLISFMGAMSFALTALQTIRSQRRYGALLEDVMEYFYWGYRWIQFPYYLCFALLGGLACEAGMAKTAALCTLGLGFCFFSSAAMYWKMVLSHKALNKLVTRYVNQKLFAKKLFAKIFAKIFAKKFDAGQVEKCLLDFAEYVGVQQNGKRCPRKRPVDCGKQGCKMARQNLECKAISGLLKWMQGYKEANPEIKTTVVYWSSFFQIPGKGLRQNRGRYILRIKILPHIKKFDSDQSDKNMKVMRSNIRKAGVFWQHLLSGTDRSQRSRIASHILEAGGNRGIAEFAFLSWGLLQYLGLAEWRIEELSLVEKYKERLGEQLDFLVEILRIYQKDCLERGEGEEDRFCKNWLEIWLMLDGVLQWKLAFHYHLLPEVESWTQEVVQGIWEKVVKKEWIKLELGEDIELVAANALILFLIEQPGKLSDFSVFEYTELTAEVCRRLRSSLWSR